MAAGQSAWRVNDAIAYDEMRERASALASELLRRARQGGASLDSVISLRAQANAVDGFDRAAVDRLTAELESRGSNVASNT